MHTPGPKHRGKGSQNSPFAAMPQSDAARPLEPSSPPAPAANASAERLPVPDDAPASDSEAETERLHDSPVKKRPAADVYSPTSSATKRQRPEDPEQAAPRAAAPESPTANGELDAAARRATNGAANGAAAAPSAAASPRAELDELRTPALPPPDGASHGALPARGAAAEPAAAAAGDDEGSGLEADGAGAGAGEDDAGDAGDAGDAEDDEGGDAEDDEADDGVDDEADDDEGDDEGDDDDENDEERIQAIDALTEIEVEFAEFRDKLHDQQIARFDLEIQMCTKGVHPELEQYHMQIREEREKRLRRSETLLAYQMRAICNQSHAGRCQVHQTHLKSCQALRGELIRRVTRDWYQVNYERRAADKLAPEYGYVAQARPHQIRRPTARTMGIRYHTGVPLPAAPPMISANEDEREEDLRQLGLR